MWDYLISNGDAGFPRILYVLIGLVAVLLFFVFILLPLIEFFKRMASPVRRVRAVVVRSHQRTSTEVSGVVLSALFSRNRFGPTYDDVNEYTYFVTFETAPGYQRVEFQVDEDGYSRYQPDDQGVLVYRGDQLISFTPEAGREAVEE